MDVGAVESKPVPMTCSTAPNITIYTAGTCECLMRYGDSTDPNGLRTAYGKSRMPAWRDDKELVL